MPRLATLAARVVLGLSIALVLVSSGVQAPVSGLTVTNSPVASGGTLTFDVTDDADGSADTIQVWIDQDRNGAFSSGEPRTSVTPSSPGATVSGSLSVKANTAGGTYELMAREANSLKAGDTPDKKATFVVDSTPPGIVSITTRDRNADGKVDAADVVFTEPIRDSSVRARDWTIGGVTAESVSTTVGSDADADDDRIQVRIDTAANAVPGTAVADVTYRRGTTRDLAGNLLPTIGSGDVAEVDGAAPVQTVARTVDADGDGNVDRLDVTLSEAIDDAGSTLDATTFAIGSGSVTGVTTGTTSNDDSVRIAVSGLSGTDVTPTVTLRAGTIADAAGNTLAADRTITATDGASPVVLSVTTRDRDANGRVDAADVVFSEPIVDSSVVANDWTIGGTTASSVVTVVGGDADANDDRVQLRLAAGITGTDAKDVTYTQDAPRDADVRDLAGNLLANIASGDLTEIDGAPPSIVAAVTDDTDRDGDVDRINVTFSEAINDSGSTLDTAFSLESGSVTAVTTGTTSDDDTVSLTVSGLTGTGPTPAVTLVAGTVVDAAGNTRATNQVHTGTADGAPPVMTAAVTKDADVDGSIDRIEITLSEPIADPASSLTSASFSVSSGSVVGVTTGDIRNDDRVIVLVDGLSGTDPTPDVTMAADSLFDPSGNALSTSQTLTSTDGAPPAMTVATTADYNTDGDTDEIVVTFSEAIADGNSTLDTTAFDIDNGTLQSVDTGTATDDDTVNLTVSGVSESDPTPDVTLVAGKVFDPAGNSLAANQTLESTDGTPPAVAAAVTRDLDGDGNVDHIAVELTEAIDDAGSTLDNSTFVLGTGRVTAVTTDDVADDHRVAITLDNATGTGVTPSVVLVAGKLFDVAGNALSSNQTFTGTSDGAAPIVRTATTRDRDEDGAVDAANIVFSEPINDSSVVADDWTIGGVTVDTVNTTVGTDADPDDENVSLQLDGSGVSGTDAKDVTYARDIPDDPDVKDLVGNRLSNVDSATVTEIDGAGPTIESADTADTAGDGSIDRIVAAFTEAIDDPTSALEPASFAVSNGSIAAVDTGATADDDTVNLSVTGIPGTNATPTVTMVAGRIADAAGNMVSTNRSISASDGAAPVVDSITTRDRDENGDVDAGDVVFSEPMSDTSIVADDWTIDGVTVEAVNTTVGQNAAANDDAVQLRLGSVEGNGSAAVNVTYSRDSPTDADAADRNGNLLRNVSAADVVEVDGAAPAVVAATTADDDVDGDIETISVTMSESLDDGASQLVADAFEIDTGNVTGVSTGSTPDDAAVVLSISGLTGTDQSPLVTLRAGRFTDGAGNSLGTDQPFAVGDGAPPVMTDAAMRDDDGDGTVDRIEVSLSEAIDETGSTVDNDTFSLSSGTILNVTTGAAGNDDFLVVVTVDLSLANNPIEITLRSGTLTDGAGNTIDANQTTPVARLPVQLAIAASRTSVGTGGSVTFTVTREDTGDPVVATVTVGRATGTTGTDGQVSLQLQSAGTKQAVSSKGDTVTLTFLNASVTVEVTTGPERVSHPSTHTPSPTRSPTETPTPSPTRTPSPTTARPPTPTADTTPGPTTPPRTSTRSPTAATTTRPTASPSPSTPPTPSPSPAPFWRGPVGVAVTVLVVTGLASWLVLRVFRREPR